ncbi:hypothetical protein ACWCQS_29070 [Streptomyces sp. NPDC002076]
MRRLCADSFGAERSAPTGLRTPAVDRAAALPGPAPDWAELRELWNAAED